MLYFDQTLLTDAFLEILDNMCSVINSISVCDVTNFRIKPSLLIKSFFQHNKKSQNKNLKNKNGASHHLTWLSVTRNCFTSERGALMFSV